MCCYPPPHVMNISTIHGLCIYIYVIYVNIRWFLCNHPNPATLKLHLKRKEKTHHQLLQSEVPYCDFSSLGIGHAFLLGGFGKQFNPRPSDHVQQWILKAPQKNSATDVKVSKIMMFIFGIHHAKTEKECPELVERHWHPDLLHNR